MTGTISPSVQNLGSTLDYFLLSDNMFSGTIPSEIALVSSLHNFTVDGNNFSGSIPGALCELQGENTVEFVKADCSPISTGEIPLECPVGCCAVCCDAETGICLDTAI